MNSVSNKDTFGSLLQEVAAENADNVALFDAEAKETTYTTLKTNIERIAEQLAQSGLESDDVVAVVLSNGSLMVQVMIGCMQHCVCAPLNTEYGQREFQQYLSALNATIIVTDQPVNHAVYQAGVALSIPILTLTSSDASLVLSPLNSTLSRTPGQAFPPNTALLLFSSGTTATPKLIPLSHHGIGITAQAIGKHLSLTSKDSTICVMPMFHVHGLIGSVFSSLISGGSVLCPTEFNETQFLNALRQQAITWYTAVPAIHQIILDAHQRDPDSLKSHHLRFVRSSSSPLGPDKMSALESALGVPVIEAYGMTECCHQLASNALPPGTRKQGSVGEATNCTITIVDEDGSRIDSPRVNGQIAVSGGGVTSGYLNNVQSDIGEYGLLTGDLGHFDEDGFLFITGRLKEIINRGGEKISPAEVDQQLMAHPEVITAACIGATHETLGEVLIGAVVSCADSELTEADIRHFISLRLAPHKVPDQILFVREIPTTMTGKPQRNVLAQRFSTTQIDETSSNLSELEELLIGIWKSVLSTDSIGLEQNFFVLGGDSLKATRVVTAMQEQLSVDLTPTLLFSAPTIQALIDWLVQHRPSCLEKPVEAHSYAADSNEDSASENTSARTQLWI